LVMRPSNPPRNVALFKNLESVATAPQFLEASRRPLEPQGFGSHYATITTQRGNSFKGSISSCGGAGYAGSSG
jgi:hypothetical protein